MRQRGLPVGLVLGLLFASFMLGACTGAAAPAAGSGGTPTEAASQGTSAGQGGGAITLPDPCRLLTQAEIKAQFTFDVASGIGSSAPGSGATSPDCNWNVNWALISAWVSSLHGSGSVIAPPP